MSIRMNNWSGWFGIGMWTSAVGFQIGSVMYDWWKKKQIQRNGYKQVQRGEVVEGWKIAIPYSIIGSFGRSIGVVPPPLPENENENDDEFLLNDPLSALVYIDNETPNDWKILRLCRLSLISPNINSTILQMIYNKQKWEFEHIHSVNERIIGLIFHGNEEETRTERCLVLVDIINKSHRMIRFRMPNEQDTIYGIAHHAKRGFVIFYIGCDAIDTDDRWEHCQASFKLPSNVFQSQVDLEQWQSISFPCGDRHSPMISECLGAPFALYYNDDDPSNHQVIALNRNFQFQMMNADEWIARLQSTTYGAKLLNAVESYGNLSPPEEWDWCPVQQFRYFTYASAIGSSVLGLKDTDIVYRRISPPSLKKLAAEAFVKGNHHLKPSQMNNLLGYDIFDGINERDKNDQMIYLPND